MKNDYDIQSYEKPRKLNYSIPSTSTPNWHSKRISAMSVCSFNLNTTTKSPPVLKEYMCFHIDGKSSQASNRVKSRIMNEVIDCVISIDTFEQQCVMFKGMLQSPRIKYHMKTIGIYQSLINSALFEHICLQNIKKLYKHAGKCDDQKQLKYIFEDAMV